jgi:SpoVK/Ycf46/Vps4 family AAA+-type ATPase
MGSLVGQTEANVRKALQIADAMAPCILYLDELDKGLSGTAGSGQLDSGVNARMLGYFLTWLNDHASDVFVVATANDIAKLPSELSRAGRFDAVYFLDLPARPERQAIWRLYLRRYRLDERQKIPPDEGWTGAEIQACCRLAVLLDVPLLTAARHVVPVSCTAHDAIERLRRWADGRCLCADRGGIYRYSDRSYPRRRIERLPA